MAPARHAAWRLPAIAAAVLLTALALKAARYASPVQLSREAAAEQVTATMQRDGWKLAAGLEMRVGGLYGRLKFNKPGCSKPVVVVLLDGNAESAHFIRADYDGEIGFIQDGEWVSQPSGMRRHLGLLLHAARQGIGLTSEPPLPILAVWQPPGPGTSSCQIPLAKAPRAAAGRVQHFPNQSRG